MQILDTQTFLELANCQTLLLVSNHFDYATLSNIDFAGKDLSKSSFQQAKLEGSDMQDTNLTEFRVCSS